MIENDDYSPDDTSADRYVVAMLLAVLGICGGLLGLAYVAFLWVFL